MRSISEALAQAAEERRLGQLSAADATCRQILTLEPANAAALDLLGVIAFQRGEFDEAARTIREAIRLEGDNSLFHGDLAAIQLALGQTDEAIVSCRRALELAPEAAQPLLLLGNAYCTQRQYDAAVAAYRRVLELEPDSAAAENNLGLIFKNQGKLDEAAASCRRALQLEPDSVPAHVNLGSVLFEQDRLDEAIASFRRALELNPNTAEAYNNWGNALQKQGSLDEAAACYRRALALNPQLATAAESLHEVEQDYVPKWLSSGGSLHRTDHIRDFDAWQTIDGWFDFQGIYDLAVAEARPGAIFVEIGCFYGRSTAYLGLRAAQAQRQVSIYAVDPWIGWNSDNQPISLFGKFLDNLKMAGLIDIVTPLRMVSRHAVRLFDDGSVDFCFIDGDHRYEAVREDLHCWFPKVRPGGLIGGHDYTGPQAYGVRKAVGEFFNSPVQASGKSWLTRKALA